MTPSYNGTEGFFLEYIITVCVWSLERESMQEISFEVSFARRGAHTDGK